jgi:hypothetical protein
MMANRATLKNFFIFSSAADAWHPMGKSVSVAIREVF